MPLARRGVRLAFFALVWYFNCILHGIKLLRIQRRMSGSLRRSRRSNMPKTTAKKMSHRDSERYNCPPFFSARIDCGGKLDEKALVEDLSLRGLKARTTESFEEGAAADIELTSTYSAPVRIRARVAWIGPPDDEQSSRVVGFSISKVRIFDWFRFMRIISQIKKEVW